MRGGAVNAFAEHHEPLEGKFCGEIQQHIEDGHKITVPQKGIRQIIAQQRGHRGKHHIVAQNLQQGDRDIVYRAEGQLPI